MMIQSVGKLEWDLKLTRNMKEVKDQESYVNDSKLDDYERIEEWF